jgi:hypothetical protein
VICHQDLLKLDSVKKKVEEKLGVVNKVIIVGENEGMQCPHDNAFLSKLQYFMSFPFRFPFAFVLSSSKFPRFALSLKGLLK